VDDIILIGSSAPFIQKLILTLNASFALKHLGSLDYFLGIEVHRLSSGNIHLSQSKYIRELLSRANMLEAKGISSPMVSSNKMSKFGTDTMSNPQAYRSIVGALQYLTITRPEIAYSVNKVCQFMANPLETHWRDVKRLLRYLRGSIHFGLLLQLVVSISNISLKVYCDTGWGSDPDDRRSTSGYCVFLGPNLISWCSKKQNRVARSSTEAEYRSMALATTELMWVQSLLKELQVSFQTPTLFCDNLSAISLSHNPVLHSRTKHMELDIHFVREKVCNKDLCVCHVTTDNQLTNILTKPLSTSRFCSMRSSLTIIDFQPP